MTTQASPEQTSESITTVIDVGIHIEGSIKVDSGKALLIKGHFTGNIESNGVVVIGEGAVCSGSLTARRVRVAGTILKSDNDQPSAVVAKEGLIVESTGVVDTGTLSYGEIELQYGARVAGNMSPIGGVEAPKQEQRPQAVPRSPSLVSVAPHQAAAAHPVARSATPVPVATATPVAPAAIRPGATPLATPSMPMPSAPASLMNTGETADISQRTPQRVGNGF